LWHGAQWTFLVWGLYHGAFLILERIAPAGPLAGMPKPLKHAYALVVVMVGWVFFRAASFADALVYLQAAAGLNGAGVGWGQVVAHVDSVVALALVCGSLGSLPLVPMMNSFDQPLVGGLEGSPQTGLLDSIRAFGGVLVLLLIFTASVVSVSSETYNPFIYFRF
jgi:alginate O-acetyltransferase complex protein AlgI